MIPELSPFYQALESPPRNGQRPVIGYPCSYAPEEIIHAAGYHPMRLFSSKADIQLAESHLQSYCCSLVRGILEDGLSQKFQYLEGIVFPHTCDSIQRLSDIWRMNLKPLFFADVVMPVKLTSPASKAYMEKVLEKLVDELGAHRGKKISQEELGASISLFNGIRSHLSTIYQIKSQAPTILSDKDLFTVTRAAMTMERTRLKSCLERLVAALEEHPSKPSAHSPKRILLSGSVCDMPELYPLIQEAGGTVVGDDLCSGQRGLMEKIPEDISPIKALALGYTKRLVCPAKHQGIHARSKAHPF